MCVCVCACVYMVYVCVRVCEYFLLICLRVLVAVASIDKTRCNPWLHVELNSLFMLDVHLELTVLQ